MNVVPSIVPVIGNLGQFGEWVRDLAQPIYNYLSGIIGVLNTVGGYIATLAKDTWQLLTILNTHKVQIDDLLAWLPPSVFAPLWAGIAIVALYKILGRS